MQRKILGITLALLLGLALVASPAVAAAPVVILDGTQMEFEVPPVIEEGRTLVPLRAIFEGLGALVSWEAESKTITATREGLEIKLQIGQQLAYRNGVPVALDVPAKIMQGRTLVPLRFVSENLGALVDWDGVTRTVTIASAAKKEAEPQADIVSNLPWEQGKYSGEVVDNKPHGQGILTLPDGSMYTGAFVDGKMQGTGTWTKPDGKEVTGEITVDKSIVQDVNVKPSISIGIDPGRIAMEKAIREKHEANPWLGNAKGDISALPGGMFLDCQAGLIYYGKDVGRAHIVKGSIFNKWKEKKGPEGILGFPTTDELTTPDQIGRYNHFEGGSIYWHPDIGAYEVHGLIREKWASMGWEKGDLGYPLSDEMTMADGVGRYSAFQGGRIYYHPVHGTYYVTGKIYLKWMGNKKNNEVGELGYPTSDPQKIAGPLLSGITQSFQKGGINDYRNTYDGMDLRGEIKRRDIVVRHQGNHRDTCSVQSMTFLLEYAYSGKYGSKFKDLSVEYLNHVTNKEAGNDDDGDYFSSIEKGYNQYGIIKESVWKYDKDWKYDYDEAEKKLTKDMINAGKYMLQGGRKLTGEFIKPFERDSTLSDQEFIRILQMLNRGIPVALGRNHSMPIVGYQYDSGYDGGGYFIFRDSYGASNGIDGYKIESFEKVKSKSNDVYVYY